MKCKQTATTQTETPRDDGRFAIRHDSADKKRLEKELYLSLCEAIENRLVLQAETLLLVGANPQLLSRKKRLQLERLIANPIEPENTFEISESVSRSRTDMRLRHPWTGEEANRLAYKNGTNDSPAIDYIAIAACRDFAFAQHDLAVMLENGEGVPPSPRLALEWYRLAAEAGDAFAQNNLASLISRGKLISFNGHEVVKWYRKSVSQNCPEAMVNMAFCLLCGQCTRRQENQAFKLAMRSFLLQQTGRAACIIGRCFKFGFGTTRDTVLARAWLAFAAERGYTWDKLCRKGTTGECRHEKH